MWQTVLAALALILTLQAAPAQAQGHVDPRCYDLRNAGRLGEPGWQGCGGKYIVQDDRHELYQAVVTGRFAINYGGIDYTFTDGPFTIFTGQVTDMSNLFNGAAFWGDLDLNHWDTSRVVSLSGAFQGSSVQASIADWDVSGVRDMSFAFNNSEFDGDISGWDVSNVTQMDGMFWSARAFDQDLSGWDVSSSANMEGMFSFASRFNQDIGNWDVSNVTNMGYMFSRASAFNQDLSGWDVQKVGSEPESFDAKASAWTNPDWKPQWTTAAPAARVVSVRAYQDDEGPFAEGDTIYIVAEFDRVLLPGCCGLPTLSLDLSPPGGETTLAPFRLLSSKEVIFDYIVPPGIETDRLAYTSTTALNTDGGGLVSESDRNPVDPTLPAPGSPGSLSANSAIVIDSIAPVATFEDVPAHFSALDSFDVTLRSSEPINEFNHEEIFVLGGRLAVIDERANPNVVLTFVPDEDAEQITISMSEETFNDRARNQVIPAQPITIQRDATAPVFADIPDDIAVDTDPGQDGAVVSWTPPTASDNLDGEITDPTASHQPGDRFPLGETIVTYTATDSSGNEAQASFTVTVTDGEAPVIIGLPEDITLPTDPGEITAVVTWEEPTATDNSGSVTLSADHAPGDTFALGDTLVTYTATDDAGLETTASFTVTVERRDYVAGATQVTTSPDRILANGTDQSEITVTLYDDVGYPLGYGGASVVLATTLGQLGPVSDQGDGRYTATLTSGIRSGEAAIAVTLDGEPVAEGLVTFEVDTAFVVAEVTERTRAFSQRRLTRTFATQPRGLGLDRRRSETPGLRYAAGLNAQGGGFAGSLSFTGRGGERPSGSFSLVDSSSSGLSGATDLDARWMDAEGRWHGWAELAFSRHKADAVTGSYGVLHLGVDRLVSEDLAIGLMLSLDRMEEEDGPNDRQEGTGWLAGPYLLAELREGLFVSSRLAWGRAEDSGRFDIYDSGFPWTGDRTTRRALATLALYGTTEWRALTLTPQVELLWGRERIGAFTVTDGFGTARVPEAEVWAARLALSNRVEWVTEALNAPALAFVTPTLNWDTGSETSGTRPSAALELGLRSTDRGPWSGEISLAADGLGDDSLDAWTLRLSAERRF